MDPAAKSKRGVTARAKPFPARRVSPVAVRSIKHCPASASVERRVRRRESRVPPSSVGRHPTPKEDPGPCAGSGDCCSPAPASHAGSGSCDPAWRVDPETRRKGDLVKNLPHHLAQRGDLKRLLNECGPQAPLPALDQRRRVV